MLKFNNAIRRIDFLKRHLATILPYLTLRKCLNIALNEMEMRSSVATPRSLPYFIKIEPTPRCQLRCTGCEQRKPEFKKLFDPANDLTLTKLKKIIDPISHAVIGVSLSFYGEPLLNPDIYSIIKHIHDQNIAVSFPTNLSLPLSDQSLERLVNCGLDSLQVSLDGATEESYSKYRCGGNFNLVLHNVRHISNIKKKVGRHRPRLIWKFIVFEHNRDEIETVRRRYREFGFDGYEIGYDTGSEKFKEQQQEYAHEMSTHQKPCYWLWNSLLVRFDGEVKPCCYSLESFDLGNAITHDIREIWRSPAYVKLREGFAHKQGMHQMHPACVRCSRRGVKE